MRCTTVNGSWYFSQSVGMEIAAQVLKTIVVGSAVAVISRTTACTLLNQSCSSGSNHAFISLSLLHIPAFAASSPSSVQRAVPTSMPRPRNATPRASTSGWYRSCVTMVAFTPACWLISSASCTKGTTSPLLPMATITMFLAIVPLSLTGQMRN